MSVKVKAVCRMGDWRGTVDLRPSGAGGRLERWGLWRGITGRRCPTCSRRHRGLGGKLCPMCVRRERRWRGTFPAITGVPCPRCGRHKLRRLKLM